MPFVRLDANGKIEAIFHNMAEEGLLEIDIHDPLLDDFLREQQVNFAINSNFIESDLSIVRILEDLIDVLIERGAFRFTDLPEMAQKKLLKRRGLRKEFAYMETLFAEDDDDEFHNIDTEGESFL